MIIIGIVIVLLLLFLIYLVLSLKKDVENRFVDLIMGERKERTELYDRLMSKNLTDYTRNTSGNVPGKPSVKSNNFLKEATEQAYRLQGNDSFFGGEG